MVSRSPRGPLPRLPPRCFRHACRAVRRDGGASLDRLPLAPRQRHLLALPRRAPRRSHPARERPRAHRHDARVREGSPGPPRPLWRALPCPPEGPHRRRLHASIVRAIVCRNAKSPHCGPFLVGEAGFEPAISSTQSLRTTGLCYSPKARGLPRLSRRRIRCGAGTAPTVPARNLSCDFPGGVDRGRAYAVAFPRVVTRDPREGGDGAEDARHL